MTTLDYVLENTYTRTLLSDSYPIAIRSQSLNPGAHHLEFHQEGGHTLLVVSTSQGVRVVQSTVPRDLRVLTELEYLRSEPPRLNEEGFFKIRWPIRRGQNLILKSISSHTDYSVEQYSEAFQSQQGFSFVVKQRLSSGQVNRFGEFQTSLQRLDELLSGRVQSVERGWQACLEQNCSPGTSGWNEYSSPQRDKRIVDLIRLTQQIMSQGQDGWFQSFSRTWAQFNKKTLMIDGRLISYQKVIELFLQGRTISDPRRPIQERWGL